MNWNEHDYGLSAERLAAKYLSEHPAYLKSDFGQYQNYWCWVENQLLYEEYCYGEAMSATLERRDYEDC